MNITFEVYGASMQQELAFQELNEQNDDEGSMAQCSTIVYDLVFVIVTWWHFKNSDVFFVN